MSRSPFGKSGRRDALRAVVDTNVLVRGILSSKGAAAAVLDAAMEGRFVLITSYHLVEELVDVLRRPRIVEKYKIEAQKLAGVLDLLEFAEVVPGVPRETYVSRDPDDDWVVAPALEAGADVIVTEDEDLLEIGQFGKVRAITAREFLRELETVA